MYVPLEQSLCPRVGRAEPTNLIGQMRSLHVSSSCFRSYNVYVTYSEALLTADLGSSLCDLVDPRLRTWRDGESSGTCLASPRGALGRRRMIGAWCEKWESERTMFLTSKVKSPLFSTLPTFQMIGRYLCFRILLGVPRAFSSIGPSSKLPQFSDVPTKPLRVSPWLMC